MGGFFTVVALSIYNFRKKGTSIAPSVYVIQTRMAAQGLVIALLSGAAGYQLYNNLRSYGLHNPHEDHHHQNHNNQHNHDHTSHK
jgi:ABC-type nickel/cobalt efflux system permease component RcnA